MTSPAHLSAILLFAATPALAEPFDTLEQLGEALFFDTNLSANRSQSCASCHSPDQGFSDPRVTAAGKAVSVGDDGSSLGDRNAPTASYAALTPEFHKNVEGEWIGGQFWDGRATTLEDQAGGPPLNPIEMGMESKAAVVARLAENPAYVTSFQVLFGANILNDPPMTYAAMSKALAAFERTAAFAPFDSKYDRFLRGEYELTRDEELGRLLFFSEQFTNCNQCHQLKSSLLDPAETFTNYEYHNIGVPTNRSVRSANGVPIETKDVGLFANPAVDDPAQRGKFRVPTLRNVAVTGPYMHNGMFDELRTVVLFYNKYNTLNEKRQINSETGKPWARPEIPQNLSVSDLTHGPALDDQRIDALVAFMKTLTDAKYEHLLD
ncbi:methylamine utilization protein MauG [Phaeobacter gallaeciensis]|uniref:Methylamine utilization protein MauG n=2 Tax=Roseobacteraceae TaxID=2854170 RepID=A0A366WTX3_9RHOB|nr:MULTISPECIES: cytochrome c peroxidase [Roseobacteraceae]MBT3140625.1 methylamine utilization protein MauG [Falsiruegeria litorea]MBT8170364.1 methylamine utilization protein MauG [Falsiruegeria litorea]RBW52597.1 methylamine utilization protein MauG [Phaeobacter gallaeciensis]